jgi:pyruvate/2-oxoglutarate dehydrogenase complex dihydrolipoamide acyltransferase (E2) component
MIMTETPLPPEEDTQPVKITRPFISPVAASLAYQNQIDLSQITGSGADGRITRQDVLDAIQNGTARLAARRNATACITLDIDLNQMDRALKARNEQQFGVISLSPIHGILAAALDALEHYPQLTIPVDDPHVHLVRPGTAAALPLPKPMLEEPLPELAARIQEIEEHPPKNTLTAPAFLIEDHSQTGITTILPALPAGQHALLAVATPKRRPVAVTNTLVIHLTVTLSLVYDPEHAAPTDAAEFLALLKRLLQDW